MQVLNQNLRAVWLERDAVVAIVDDRILNDNVGAAVRIPTIGVLRCDVVLAIATDVDILKDHVRAVGHEVVVLRRVTEVEVGDGTIVQADGAEEDGSENVDILSVQVVPNLSVAVEHASAVDVDVFATQLEESGRVLERLEEGVCLPVVRVIGELDVCLDICSIVS